MKRHSCPVKISREARETHKKHTTCAEGEASPASAGGDATSVAGAKGEMPFTLRRLPRPASASRPPSSPAIFHEFPVRENACHPRDMKWSARPSRRTARESGLSMRRHSRRPLRPPAGAGEGVGSSLSCVSRVSRESRPGFPTLPFLPDSSDEKATFTI